MARLWACPNGCGSKRGPERPRRNATIRYCLTCSGRTGVLVERVSPAAERERERRTASRLTRATRAEERAAEVAAARRTVIGLGGLGFDTYAVDIEAVWSAIWATPTGRDVRRRLGRVPRLNWRRSPRHGRIAGRAYSWEAGSRGGQTTVTIGQGCPAAAVSLLLHEAAHVACAYETGHAQEWRAMYRTLLLEAYELTVDDPGDDSSHALTDRVTAAVSTALATVGRLVVR